MSTCASPAPVDGRCRCPPTSSPTPVKPSPLNPAAPRWAGVPAGVVVYPRGYSLVGLPQGTTVGANSPLYGWFDQGAGGTYTVQSQTQPVSSGHGYWAWFACPSLVSLQGPGTPTMSLPLGAYHASMVGNPSATSPVTVSGFDFGALWDPSLNNGAGGYHISGYRATATLPVGVGLWAFSYVPTTIHTR